MTAEKEEGAERGREGGQGKETFGELLRQYLTKKKGRNENDRLQGTGNQLLSAHYLTKPSRRRKKKQFRKGLP